MKTEIFNKLHTFITSDLLKQPNKIIEPTQAILSTGIIDSFSLVDISLFVEDTFGVEIYNTELNANHFDTLNELVELVEGKM